MNKVLITGSKGFISKNIANILKISGFYVIGTSRSPEPVSNFDKVYRGILGEPLKDIFESHKIDVMIHCAFDKRDKDNSMHEKGTRFWAAQAERNGVGLQIFMSSISAAEDAVSSYGQKKYELEKWFLAHNHIVFRLGLVIGNGGIFQTIISMVKKSPVVPLIDRGRTLTYVSDIDTIIKIVRDSILEKGKIERGKVLHLQQGRPVFFVKILEEIRRQYHLFCVFIPIPYFVISFFMFLAERCKFLSIGINTDNLKGMRQNSQRELKSDLNFLGYSESPVEILIKKLLI